MSEESIVPARAAKKVSPDGNAVAIRTPFEDSATGLVQSWIFATATGFTGFKTEADVTDWLDVE